MITLTICFYHKLREDAPNEQNLAVNMEIPSARDGEGRSAVISMLALQSKAHGFDLPLLQSVV